jgi:hypothetical protein
MSIENIIFEDTDNFEQTAIKTVLLNAGSSNLKKQMERLKINYSKVVKNDRVQFVLRHKDFKGGWIVVTL